MASFSSWILSIAGIVLTGVLIDLILPNGQTNKYIKSIFSIFVIFVTISPLINLINKDIDLNSLVNSQIQIDQNYIEHINNSRVLALNKSITNEAEKYGLNGIDIEFIIDEKTTTLKIEKVNIYLKNLVIDENSLHINKYKVLKEVVQMYIDIGEEDINFYE